MNTGNPYQAPESDSVYEAVAKRSPVKRVPPTWPVGVTSVVCGMLFLAFASMSVFLIQQAIEYRSAKAPSPMSEVTFEAISRANWILGLSSVAFSIAMLVALLMTVRKKKAEVAWGVIATVVFVFIAMAIFLSPVG